MEDNSIEKFIDLGILAEEGGGEPEVRSASDLLKLLLGDELDRVTVAEPSELTNPDVAVADAFRFNGFDPLLQPESPQMAETISPAELRLSPDDQSSEDATMTDAKPAAVDLEALQKIIDDRIAKTLKSSTSPAPIASSNDHNASTSKSSSSVSKQTKASNKKAGSPPIGADCDTKPRPVYDDVPSPEEIKKMSSKEKRQLRNKISARNFRVRRKEYISSLEAEIQLHKSEASELRETLNKIMQENQQLREEVAMLRAKQDASKPAEEDVLYSQRLPSESPAEEDRNSLPYPNSPSLLLPNLHKDVPNSSALASSSSGGERWRDTRILVHRAILPEWNWADILTTPPAKPISNVEKESVSSAIAPVSTMYSQLDLSVFDEKPHAAVLLGALVWELMATGIPLPSFLLGNALLHTKPAFSGWDASWTV
ncbi:uncharacterized protein VTP21DRAFT_5187 [Calcarisporiella thermophila]|uniref:uncharacterized protein n=1 Tax=Calcarisporiella thermophila TaxID=911321 RepID=UPI003743C16D